MFKRIFCVLCALLLLASCAAAEEAEQPFSCDFDLTFSLNTEAFSPILRGRAKGYADMLGCIRVKGNFTWSEANNSFELTGTLFYKDKPDVSVPFRVFGLPGMLYFTSPAINDEIILLNMSAFLEFAAKAKENLGVPLPYFAFFYPHTTEFSFGGMVAAWENIIGRSKSSGSAARESSRESIRSPPSSASLALCASHLDSAIRASFLSAVI